MRMDVNSASMAPKKFIQATIRLYDAEADRLDAIVTAMSGKVAKASAADAVRYVLERGFENAERDLGIGNATKPTKPREKSK